MFVSLSLSRTLFISPSPSVSLSVLAHHTSATRHILSPKSVGLRASGTLRGLWGSTSFLSPFFLFVRGTSRRIVERKEERSSVFSTITRCRARVAGVTMIIRYRWTRREVPLSIDRGQFVRLGRKTFPGCFCNADFNQFACYNWVVAAGILRKSSFDRPEPGSFCEETLKVK